MKELRESILHLEKNVVSFDIVIINIEEVIKRDIRTLDDSSTELELKPAIREKIKSFQKLLKEVESIRSDTENAIEKTKQYLK